MNESPPSANVLLRPGVRLELPATSANVGPGFDAVGLALSLKLRVEAHAALAYTISATGRDAELCGQLKDNLILDTYADVLRGAGRSVLPLRLVLQNEIPLGMGCGSSAAALLAGVALANHFGNLGWSDTQMVAEASRREGHPDNVAACWYGGFTVSAQDADEVQAVSFPGNSAWRVLLVMQASSLATTKARALLPDTYSRADAVFNLQRVALLVAAFAEGRLDLLRAATADRMHQPFRMEACPLLGALLPLAGEADVAAVTLSGAGPSVLMFLNGASEKAVEERVRAMAGQGVEVVPLRIAAGATRRTL